MTKGLGFPLNELLIPFRGKYFKFLIVFLGIIGVFTFGEYLAVTPAVYLAICLVFTADLYLVSYLIFTPVAYLVVCFAVSPVAILV